METLKHAAAGDVIVRPHSRSPLLWTDVTQWPNGASAQGLQHRRAWSRHTGTEHTVRQRGRHLLGDRSGHYASENIPHDQGSDATPVTAMQLPCRHAASVPVAAIQWNTRRCIAQHITVHVNAGCSKAVAHARYQWSSCLTQTHTLTLLVALPRTSRMLHTFAKPLGHEKYEHFLRALA